MKYVRRSTRDVWHFMEDCEQYPADTPERFTYGGLADRPTWGETCDQCISLEDRKAESSFVSAAAGPRDRVGVIAYLRTFENLTSIG